MHTYTFQLPNADKNMGTVYLPNETANNCPIMVFCHGWGGDRVLSPANKVVCDTALSQGIAFVTLDFYGCGDTGGDYSGMTYGRWAENLADLITWIEEQSFADKNKIGCYSISSGTTTALRLAAYDHRIAYVVSIATCISGPFGMNNGGPTKKFADHCRELVNGGKQEIFGVEFALDFFADTIGNAPIHTIKNIECPVLIMQRMADNTFRLADAKMAYDLLCQAERTVKYIEIPDGDHGLGNTIDQAVEYTFSWLQEIF